MSFIKTFISFSILAGALATGVKSERQFDLEADKSVRQTIEAAVRMNAVDFNPKVQLVAPELKDFEITGIQISRPRVMGWLDDNSGIEAYARFEESGSRRCMTLSLEWMPQTETWRAEHSGIVDRCEPVW